MPNHVKTVVKFKKLNSGDIVNIMNKIATPMGDEGLIFERRLDFDKIIPEPRTKEECPEDCIRTESSSVEKDDDRPWFNWYKWRNRYWNTKWGAYDCYTEVKKSSILFVFSTAWSPALPIFEKLADLGYDIEIKYADENLR